MYIVGKIMILATTLIVQNFSKFEIQEIIEIKEYTEVNETQIFWKTLNIFEFKFVNIHAYSSNLQPQSNF